MFGIGKNKEKIKKVLAKDELTGLKAYLDSQSSEKPKSNGNGHKDTMLCPGCKSPVLVTDKNCPGCNMQLIPDIKVVNETKPAAKAKKMPVSQPATEATAKNTAADKAFQGRAAEDIAVEAADKKRQLEEQAAADEEDERERERKIPGYGVIIGTKKKFLPEATNIDKGQALTIALGRMQENMLNPDRVESLFDLFAEDMMRLQKSVDHFSLDQYLMARQQDADKNASIGAKNDLYGSR
jgi:hypothetical protein